MASAREHIAESERLLILASGPALTDGTDRLIAAAQVHADLANARLQTERADAEAAATDRLLADLKPKTPRYIDPRREGYTRRTKKSSAVVPAEDFE